MSDNSPCSLQPGTTVRQFHIVRFIGRGTLGEVYHVKHNVLGKHFALKLLPKGFEGHHNAFELFKREAHILSHLKHPNIIEIDDFDEASSYYWLRMELIKGLQSEPQRWHESLGSLMDYRGGRLSEPEVVYYTYYLLTALSYAHQKGVVHRNLKPENVLLDGSQLKLSDLGMSRVAGDAWEDFHLPGRGPDKPAHPFEPVLKFHRSLPALMRSFDYFAPEVRSGRPASEASDLYAAGLIVFQMLTGHQRAGLRLPSAIHGDIRSGWDDWLARALAEEPAERFATAMEMLSSMPGLQAEQREAADQARSEEQQSPSPTEDTAAEDDDAPAPDPQAVARLEEHAREETADLEVDPVKAGEIAEGEDDPYSEDSPSEAYLQSVRPKVTRVVARRQAAMGKTALKFGKRKD